jgi:hypothetical protein
MDTSNPNLNQKAFVAFLDFNTLLVNSQRQVYAIYLDFNKAFDFVLHALLLRKRDETGLPPAYVTWFHSYPTNRLSRVCYRGALSTPYDLFFLFLSLHRAF